MSQTIVKPWREIPENRLRYQQEMRALRSRSRSTRLEVNDLDDGSTVFTVVAPDPPGCTIYLTTRPDYPNSAPVLLAEKGNRPVVVSSSTVQTWKKTNTLADVVDDVIGRVTRKKLALILGLSGGLVVIVGAIVATLLLASINKLDGVAKDQTAVAGQSTALAQRRATVMAGLAQNANDSSLITALAGIDAEQAANNNRANQLLTAQALQGEYTGQALTQGALIGKANAEQSGTATANANALNTAAAQATASYLTANAPTATPVPTATPIPAQPTAAPVVRTTVRQDVLPTPVPATATTVPQTTTAAASTSAAATTDAPSTTNPSTTVPSTTNPSTTVPATTDPAPSTQVPTQNNSSSGGNGSPKTTQPPAKTTQPPANTTQPPAQTTQTPAKTTVAPPPNTTQPPPKTTVPPPPPSKPSVTGGP